jgi:hypothetical protein
MTKHPANDNAEAMRLEEALSKAEQLCSKTAADEGCICDRCELIRVTRLLAGEVRRLTTSKPAMSSAHGRF